MDQTLEDDIKLLMDEKEAISKRQIQIHEQVSRLVGLQNTLAEFSKATDVDPATVTKVAETVGKIRASTATISPWTVELKQKNEAEAAQKLLG